MLDKLNARLLLYVLIFPAFFQEALLQWVWGGTDDFIIMLLKRIFLLLPAGAIILCCWVTIGCALTVIIRQQRRQYVSTLFITWWDLARAIFSFWGGFFRFCFFLLGWLFSFIRLCILGIWLALQDILFAPLRTLRGFGDIASKPGTPWIAVWMTLAWCVLEGAIMTLMMTHTTEDIVNGMTQGFAIETWLIQVVLFMFLTVILIGSYAVLATFQDAIQRRSIKMILLMVVVEISAWFFEVMFLYREFVDALVPWLANYAGPDFSIGPGTIIAVATFAWMGIRSFTWFFFAAHGTPTILAIIQRSGLHSDGRGPLTFSKKDHFIFIRDALDHIKDEIDWVHKKGDEVVSAFILPPLQIVAAVINFFTMLISAKHIFELPFKSYKDMLHADQLVRRVKEH